MTSNTHTYSTGADARDQPAGARCPRIVDRVAGRRGRVRDRRRAGAVVLGAAVHGAAHAGGGFVIDRLIRARRSRLIAVLFAAAAALSSLGMLALAGAATAAPLTCPQSMGTVTCTDTSAGEQTFTVPDGVTSLQVAVTGGQGGSSGWVTGSGGRGAQVAGSLTVTPHQTLYLEVGANGGNGPQSNSDSGGAAGGFNGGGAGGAGYPGGAFLASAAGGSGGGGASDIRTAPASATGSLDTRLIVAAGGGGAPGSYSHTANGGDAGQPGTNYYAGDTGGGAGSASTGGAGGNNAFPGEGGSAGTQGSGGAGGSSSPTLSDIGGGGGGGGLYGGGGGSVDAGGGGGSSLVPTGFTASLDSTGTPQIVLSYPAPPDTTPPSDAPTISGTVGNDGWYTSDVTVDWNWTDTGSGIDPNNCTQTSTSSGEGSAVTISSSCQDQAGNTATDSVTVKIDKTAPKDNPTVSGTQGANGWYTSDVTVAWNWSDAGSGVDPSHCTQTSNSSGEGAAVTISSSCKDLAGNTATDSRAFKVDKTPPTVSCASPAPVFLLGGTASVGASVADVTSGPAQPTVSAAADTTSAGVKTVSLTGKDNAGNATTVTCSYTVAYGFGGFSAPLPKSTLLKSGSTIPVKFVLTDSAGHPIAASTAAALATAGKIQATLAGPAITPQTVPCAWNSTNQAFQCNIKTPGVKTGPTNPYTITAAENLGGGFITAPAIGTAVDPETVYFK